MSLSWWCRPEDATRHGDRRNPHDAVARVGGGNRAANMLSQLRGIWEGMKK